jgi:hypothetical protein
MGGVGKLDTNALLVSDQDRARAIEALRERYADGSLNLEEYSQRLDTVLSSHSRDHLRKALAGFEDDLQGPARATSLQRRSVGMRRSVATAIAAIAGILVVGLALAHRGSAPRFDRSGVVVGTPDPFAGLPTADVYVVPLDRSAWDGDGVFSLLRLQRALSRRGLRTVITPPLAINRTMYDSTRHQLNGEALTGALGSAYARHPPAWPATVVGVTSLDLFSTSAANYRFLFMSSYGHCHTGFAAISTARLHGGAADLEKMALRAAGLYFYRLSRSPGWSVMHEPIRSGSDLEQMSDAYPASPELLKRRQQQTRRSSTQC